MRALLIVHLDAVLCVDLASLLKCYACMDQTSNDQCLTAVDCVKNEKFYQTVTLMASDGGIQRKSISKQCTFRCKEFPKFYQWESFHECCPAD